MAVITTRAGKGAALTHNEVDANFTGLNSELGTKVDVAGARAAISVTGAGSYNSATGVMTITGGVTSVNGYTGAVSLSKTDLGLGSVENKSSATIRSEITIANVTSALGYTPENGANRGVAGGYASLDGAGKVPAAQLPSYVDDVVEVANLASLPGSGEAGKIYVTLDTNKTYRWSGSAYVEISPSPGSTDSLAEGSTNLYFTQARARASVSASGSLSYNSSTGVFSFSDAVTSVAGRTGAVTLTSSDVGLGNVENKSSATIRGELTSSNVTTALGFTPYNATNPNNYTSNTGTVTSVSGTGSVSGLTLTGTVTGSGSLTLGGTLSLTSGQVTSALGYTPPQPTGTGASGTWAINITGGAERLSALGNYVLNASTNGRDFADGIQAGFVDLGTNGYPQYGSIVRIKTYPNDGGAAELYFPYGASYGGSAMRYRLGQYNNAGWTSWKTVLDDSNYGDYAPSKTGTGAQGTWGIRITGFANQGGPRLYSTDGAYNYDAANPYYGYLTYNGVANRWRFKVSPATPDAVEVAYADSAGSATDSSKLPLSGGTISGTVSINGGGSQPLNLTTSSSGPWGFGLTRSDVGVSSKIFLHNGSGSWAWVYEHNPVLYNGGAYNPFLHSGNYSSYALPLSGGTMTGNIQLGSQTNRYLSWYTNTNWVYYLAGEGDNLRLYDSEGASFLKASYGSGGTTKFVELFGSTLRVNNNGTVTSGGKFLADAWVHSDRDFANGTLIQTDINYAVTYGDPFILEIRGNSYGDAVPYDIQYQGYIYADTIINHGGYSNGTYISGLVAINYNGNLCFWFPRQSYWNGFYVRVYVPYATYPRNRVSSVSNSSQPTSAKQVALSANIRQSLHSGNYTSYSPSLTGSGASGTWSISVTGSAASLSGNYSADDWLRTAGDGSQFKIYGNSRTLIFRTDGSNNPHGGGGYSAIWYHGGSADANRRMILDTSGGLWTNSYGWLHDHFLAKSGGAMTGDITFSNGRKGLVGVYDPTQTQAVWAMGPSYVLTNGGASSNYGSFYGLGWSYEPDYGGSGNNPQSKNGLGHQLLLMWAGVTRTAIGTGIWTDGNITATGNVTAFSDERIKKDWSLIESGFVNRLAVLRCGTYTRIDSGQRQAGVSAQSMREILPEVVSEDSDGTLALAYGNAALVSAVELAKELVSLKQEVAELRARVH